MTVVTDAQRSPVVEWAAVRRPTRGSGLDAWEERLAGVAEAGEGGIAAGLAAVEDAVAAAVREADSACPGSSRGIDGPPPAPRLRPLLALTAAGFGGREAGPPVVTAAVVAELAHLGIVWHDRVPLADGTDETAAESRLAILAGDLLSAHACRLVMGLGEGSMRAISEGIARLAEGQLRAAAGPAPGEDAIDHYCSVAAARAASLPGAAARLGAMAGGASAALAEAVAGAVEAVVLAAQLADDAAADAGDGSVPGGGDATLAHAHAACEAARRAVASLPACPARDVLSAMAARAGGPLPA